MAFAKAPSPRESAAPAGLAIDVLTHDERLVASFVCPREAFRYASLIYDPACEPIFRRRRDGDLLRFSPGLGIAAVLAWDAAHSD